MLQVFKYMYSFNHVCMCGTRFSRVTKGSSTHYDYDLNGYYYLLYGTGDTLAQGTVLLTVFQF